MKKQHFIHTMILLFLILTLLVAMYILSSQNADHSSKQSHTVTRWILGLFHPGFSEMEAKLQDKLIKQYDVYIRKAAHFSEFALLGFLLSLLFGRNRKACYTLLFSSLLSFLCGCADEFHQHYVSVRGPAFTDVLIDFSGSISGICLGILILFLFYRCRNLDASKEQ